MFLQCFFQSICGFHTSFAIDIYSKKRFELHTACGGALLNHLSHLTLPDKGKTIPLQTPEALDVIQFRQIFSGIIDQDLSGTIRQDTAPNGAKPRVLPKLNGYFRILRLRQADGSLEKKIPLARNAQLGRMGIPQHPAKSIQQIALTAAVGADNGSHPGRKREFMCSPETFKTFKL